MNVLVAQFDLLVNMCKGYNTGVIQYLEDDEGIKKKIGIAITFDFIMNVLNSNKYNYLPELKAKLIELLKGEISII